MKSRIIAVSSVGLLMFGCSGTPENAESAVDSTDQAFTGTASMFWPSSLGLGGTTSVFLAHPFSTVSSSTLWADGSSGPGYWGQNCDSSAAGGRKYSGKVSTWKGTYSWKPTSAETALQSTITAGKARVQFAISEYLDGTSGVTLTGGYSLSLHYGSRYARQATVTTAAGKKSVLATPKTLTTYAFDYSVTHEGSAAGGATGVTDTIVYDMLIPSSVVLNDTDSFIVEYSGNLTVTCAAGTGSSQSGGGGFSPLPWGSTLVVWTP